MNELISVIIPVYNTEAYLSKCVDSVLNQSHRDIELILVDDGSTDQSGNMCDEYSQKDDRVKVIHKRNGGAADSRNAGLDVAKGVYIGFVDSDDWIEEKMYETLLNILKSSDVYVACCERMSTDKEYKPLLKEDIIVKRIKKEDALKSTFFPLMIKNAVWDKLYKREVFDDIRFQNGNFAEDTPAMYTILHRYGDVMYTNARLYHYSIREDSVTTLSFNPRKMHHIGMFKERIGFMAENYPQFIDLSYKTYLSILNHYYFMSFDKTGHDKFKEEHETVIEEIHQIPLRRSIFNQTLRFRSRTIFVIIRLFHPLIDFFFSIRYRTTDK
jgi:glycosyltransferase involved in cell wall biosynthesis